MITAEELLEQSIVHGAIKDRAKLEAASLSPAVQPQIVYMQAPVQRQSISTWFTRAVIVALIGGAFLAGRGVLPISISAVGDQEAHTTVIALPTSRPLAGGVQPGLQSGSSAQPIPSVVPEQALVQAPAAIEAAPTAIPNSGIAIPAPIAQPAAEAQGDVQAPEAQPTVEAAPPMYEYNPNGPDPMPAKTTGEYAGWNGGAGAGWVIPTAQAMAQPTAQPVAARNRDETVATQADYKGWGGGGGKGWVIPEPAASADKNNGWSVGN